MILVPVSSSLLLSDDYHSNAMSIEILMTVLINVHNTVMISHGEYEYMSFNL